MRTNTRTSRRPAAFTLVEMTVVLGLLALLLALAIPTLDVLKQNRSVGGASDRVDSLLGRARALAVEQQQAHGLALFFDPATERVLAAIVQSQPRPPYAGTGVGYFLGLVDDARIVELPPGVLFQEYVTVGFDRYFGFSRAAFQYNAAGSFAEINQEDDNSPLDLIPGPVVMFDARGQIAPLVPFAYRTEFDPPAGGGRGALTEMGKLLFRRDTLQPTDPRQVVPARIYTDGEPRQTALALAAFDAPNYLAEVRRATDGAVDNLTVALNDTPVADGVSLSIDTAAEQQEERWLDDNALPMVINRYNGTILEAE